MQFQSSRVTGVNAIPKFTSNGVNAIPNFTSEGVNAIELEWLTYYFLMAKHKLRSNCLTESIYSFSGVSQDSILGPYFLLYFSMALFSNYKFFAGQDRVEKLFCSDMNRLSESFVENKLLLNQKTSKTEWLLFDTNP